MFAAIFCMYLTPSPLLYVLTDVDMENPPLNNWPGFELSTFGARMSTSQLSRSATQKPGDFHNNVGWYKIITYCNTYSVPDSVLDINMYCNINDNMVA